MQLPELAPFRPGVCHANPPKRLFFALYYKTDDDAFKRAAATWKKEVQSWEGYFSGPDAFYEKEIVSEADFKHAWQEIADKAKKESRVAWMGNCFTHASKQTDGNDGLEFLSGNGEDGTLKRAEISSLPKLPWDKASGCLILSSCNSGLLGRRAWTPAETFAKSQGVVTLGQTGYAYFSTEWNKYDKSTPESNPLYLWAYQRGQNSTFGNGCRMFGKVYNP